MDLEQLRSDWDALAKRDALWAILIGRLVYLSEMPRSGYVGKQYCVVNCG